MMGNKGKGRQHINVLMPSRHDQVELCRAVDIRYRELCALYYRQKGTELIPPSHLDQDLLLWRTMAVRYTRRRDYRHTLDELKSVRRIAQWTLDLKCDLTNTPRKVLQWDS